MNLEVGRVICGCLETCPAAIFSPSPPRSGGEGRGEGVRSCWGMSLSSIFPGAQNIGARVSHPQHVAGGRSGALSRAFAGEEPLRLRQPRSFGRSFAARVHPW